MNHSITMILSQITSTQYGLYTYSEDNPIGASIACPHQFYDHLYRIESNRQHLHYEERYYNQTCCNHDEIEYKDHESWNGSNPTVIKEVGVLCWGSISEPNPLTHLYIDYLSYGGGDNEIFF